MAAMTIKEPEIILNLIDHQLELSEMIRDFMLYIDNIEDHPDLIDKKIELYNKMIDIHRDIDKVIDMVEIH